MTVQQIDNFSGKVAVITGGGSGIGKATAIALSERGVKIVIGDISEKSGEEAVKEINDKLSFFFFSFQHKLAEKKKLIRTPLLLSIYFIE